jgi:hypothetical protein
MVSNCSSNRRQAHLARTLGVLSASSSFQRTRTSHAQDHAPAPRRLACAPPRNAQALRAADQPAAGHNTAPAPRHTAKPTRTVWPELAHDSLGCGPVEQIDGAQGARRTAVREAEDVVAYALEGVVDGGAEDARCSYVSNESERCWRRCTGR